MLNKAGSRAARSRAACRVGLFGKLGAGNVGNNASVEAIINYLRTEQPDAMVDAMCSGPTWMRTRYGVKAELLSWHDKYLGRPRRPETAIKVAGKCIDTFRIASWVRRHDVVIVPGAGVLETSLPMVPRSFPLSMFLLCLFGRVFGTKVALVSVGAGQVRPSLTSRMLDAAARLAFYRSYRDEGSRAAMRDRGLDTSRDHVYTDLAFALTLPECEEPDDPRLVGVGVMEFCGSQDDRRRAQEIYSSYVTEMTHLIEWLIDSDRNVRLFVGDTNGSDDAAVQEIVARLRASRPDLDPSLVVAESARSFADIARALLPASSVVAIRYHNVVGALMLSKPTLSISYASKHESLMADMGVPEFSLPASTLNASQLIERFTELDRQSARVRQILLERNAAKAQQLSDQFAELSAVLFPDSHQAHVTAARSDHE